MISSNTLLAIIVTMSILPFAIGFANAALPDYRLANYTCADALETVSIVDTASGPKLDLGFRLGYESCVDDIKNILPLDVDGKACIGIEFLGGDRVVYCMASSGMIF